MSLSSFGKPLYEKELRKIFDINNFQINMDYFEFHKKSSRSFSKKFIEIFGEPYLDINLKENFEKYKNIASSAQLLLELTIKNLLLKAIQLSGEKKEIGWGNQIRSYVFHPYNMVKDHRTKCESSNIQAVMDGKIDNFIRAYLLAKLEN